MDLTTGLLAAIPGLFRLLLQVGLVIVGATCFFAQDGELRIWWYPLKNTIGISIGFHAPQLRFGVGGFGGLWSITVGASKLTIGASKLSREINVPCFIEF